MCIEYNKPMPKCICNGYMRQVWGCKCNPEHPRHYLYGCDEATRAKCEKQEAARAKLEEAAKARYKRS